MYEHNALGFWSGLALCLTKVRSSRARYPVTVLLMWGYRYVNGDKMIINGYFWKIFRVTSLNKIFQSMMIKLAISEYLLLFLKLIIF